MGKATHADSRLRRQASGLLIGYALQFLAGMVLNLFVRVPSSHPGANDSAYFGGVLHGLWWALGGGGNWALATHAGLAVLLVLGSISLAVMSLLVGTRRWIVASTIAALTTIGALFNGLSFINYNHDVSSLIMAICWLLAVGSLAYVLVTDQTHAKR
jgi:hypothetical protein